MYRKLLFSLAIISIGVSFLGCQSDAQKMDKGLAQEYQDRYNSCLDSVKKFSRYAGFGFIEERGVCQCNGNECHGGQICNQFAQCEDINSVKKECTEGEKICVSPTIGQICNKNNRWEAPIACEGNNICNSQAEGDSICAPKCSDNGCFQDEKGAYVKKCHDGNYEDEIMECGNVSCTLGENNIG